MLEHPDLFASENLINCWIREDGPVETRSGDFLWIPLSEGGLEAQYRDRTLLGDVRLKSLVSRGGKSLQPMELAEILSAEIQKWTSWELRKVSDWRENLESSLRVSEKLFAERGAAQEKPLDLIQSEQSLLHGHRFHPSPKSRIGFSEEDLELYSPEWKPRFRLRYLGVADELAVFRGQTRFLDHWKNQVKQVTGFDGGFVLPLHPWQARKALKAPEIREELKRGALVDLGEIGPQFHPTSSVRTLYQPEWDLFVKTSLDVRITNCIRRNLPQEMETISWVQNLFDEFPVDRRTFRMMREPMSLDLHPRIPLHLGSIFREGVARERQEGIEPVLAGALFGDRDFSLMRLRKIIPEETSLLKWFREYCEALVPPVFDAFSRHGMMFEPHLQNILVGIREGKVVRVLQRDLDNIKVAEGSPAFRALEKAPAGVRDELVCSRSSASKRLSYCLIVNHLAEAIATLARLRATKPSEISETEQDLWMQLRDVLRAVDPQLAKSPVLWAKMNLVTRFTRIPDREAPFAEIPNPMASCEDGRGIA